VSLPLIIQLCYAVFCVGLAWINWYVINKGLRVFHAINGAVHIAAAVFATIVCHWTIGICCLLIARVFFDWFLNMFRGLPLGYVSLKPKSWADIAEKKIFKMNGILPKLVWIGVIIILNVIYALT
jgi:hypothetical protein